MRLAAHQPQYLPWLGYFDKMARVDIFVLLDTVQYKKNEWQNRNRIRTATGWQWLTVPVHYRFPMRIGEVRIDDTTAWRRRHREALRQAYARAPHGDAILPTLADLLDNPVADLATLNTLGARALAALLGVATPVMTASSLGDLPEGADDRLIALCRLFGVTTYLAGAGGRDYMDMETWRRAGISVEFQEFRHPVYPQGYRGFEPNLSCVDALMHLGPGCLATGARRERVAA
jgi:WbqC-like protein